jgi:hypothetical protein
MQSGSTYSGPKVRRSRCHRTGRVRYIIDTIRRRDLISMIENDTGRYVSERTDWEIVQRHIHESLSRYFWDHWDCDLSDWLRQNSAQVIFGIDWVYRAPKARGVPQGHWHSSFQWGISFSPGDPLESFFALTFL